MSVNNSELRNRLESLLLRIKRLKEDFPLELDIFMAASVNCPQGEPLDEVVLNTYQDSEALFKISNAVGDIAETFVEQEVYADMIESNYGIIVLCGDNSNLTKCQPHIWEDKLYKVTGISHIGGIPHYHLEGICVLNTVTKCQVDASYEARRFIIQTSHTSLN